MSWIDWLIGNELLENRKDLSPRLNRLVSAYRSLESRLSNPRVISSMGDIDPGFDAPLLEKGDAKRPADPVPRGYLSMLKASGSAFRTPGSGRRELAEVIASADNPLTARVMVNRLWHHLFGRGIVATVDDFGRFGDKPTHPELLDYLAGRFVRDGWSVKRLLRLLVLSETFRQSSRPSSLATQVDPDNRSLHHYPLRRLEAEVVRDTILAASGGWNRLFGPSIQPFRDDPKDYRKLLSGPLDGNGRRSLYLKVTRMESPPFLELFDFRRLRPRAAVETAPTCLPRPWPCSMTPLWSSRPAFGRSGCWLKGMKPWKPGWNECSAGRLAVRRTRPSWGDSEARSLGYRPCTAFPKRIYWAKKKCGKTWLTPCSI